MLLTLALNSLPDTRVWDENVREKKIFNKNPLWENRLYSLDTMKTNSILVSCWVELSEVKGSSEKHLSFHYAVLLF